MPQFLIFCLVGAANSLVGLAVIFALKYWGSWHDGWANAVGYAVGVTMSFVLNKTLTFAHRGTVPKAAIKFAAVQLIAYLLNLGCVLALINLGLNNYIAQAMGVLPYTLAGFLGSKFFAFRQSRDDSPVRSQQTRTS
jgi:putative flippase GtrA